MVMIVKMIVINHGNYAYLHPQASPCDFRHVGDTEGLWPYSYRLPPGLSLELLFLLLLLLFSIYIV